jgi:hypothetical protein
LFFVFQFSVSGGGIFSGCFHSLLLVVEDFILVSVMLWMVIVSIWYLD